MNRRLVWLAGIALFAGVCWLFPLFHLVPLERAAEQKAAATFNPTEFAERFWSERLLPSLDRAVKAGVLLPMLARDPATARRQYARSLGISDSHTYFLSGEGRVVGVSDSGILLAVTGAATQPAVLLETGLLFGNALRDGTGLLDVNDYPNSQDFNGISAALNHLVETRVLPELRERAKVGSLVRFAGCAEVNDEATDLHPLRVVPLQAEVQ